VGAKLETMATEEQKNVLQQDTSEVSSESELFTDEVRRELSEREVFVGDEISAFRAFKKFSLLLLL